MPRAIVDTTRLQTCARNEAEALAEARHAIERIVLPSQRPIELLPRASDVLVKQAALIESSFGLLTERIGEGTQARLRVLPDRLASSAAFV